MASMTTMTGGSAGLTRSIVTGIGGGIVGGIAFGVMMAAQGMLPMVGMLVGSESPVVGFIVHMLISSFIGATYGVIAARLPRSWAGALISGAVYGGIVWWVLGALIIMPLLLGMNEMVLQIGEMQISSLIGHLVFGVIMGVVTKVAAERMG